MKIEKAFAIGYAAIVMWMVSACGTTGVYYAVTYPPEIELPKEETIKLGIVTWVDTTQYNPEKKKQGIIVEAYHYFEEGLAYRLQSIDNVLLMTPDIKLERSRSFETPPDLAPDIVIEKCERIGVDYFLVIEDFDISSSKSLVLFRGDEQSKSIYTKVTLTLYAKDGNRINRSVINHGHDLGSEETDGFLDGLLSSKPSVKRNAHLLKPQSEAIVEEYLQKFRPLTENKVRGAYYKEEFSGFVEFMKHRDFQSAENLVLPLVDSANKKIAKRAAYNMFILREAEGELVEAQSWLRKYESYSSQ